MDGITKITERILAEADAACTEISEKAAKRCDAIRAEYEQKAEEAYNSVIAKGSTEIELDAQRYVRNAQMDARKEVLSLKQDMIDAAFAAARDKIVNMPKNEYTAWVVKVIADAADGDEEIILDAKDSAIGSEIVAKANAVLAAKGRKTALSLSDTTRSIDGGVVLRKGNIEMNCSLDAILAQHRKDLASEVAQLLFE